jgi:hypothetical protein
MFVTFKTFNDPELAKELISLFDEVGIQYETEDDSKFFDISFAYNEATRVIAVKIKQEDFTKANQMLNKIDASEFEDINKDYHVFSMSNDELQEIIKKPDEWTQLDLKLATKLLIERGVELQATEIENLGNKRIVELSKPDESQRLYIYLGWFFILVGSIFWLIAFRLIYLFIIILGIVWEQVCIDQKKCFQMAGLFSDIKEMRGNREN